MSKIIPNSFQTPNAYVDEFMAFLTPEEYVVLSYAARRILGFHKERDHISLSQFSDGLERDGARLDYGTGLSKPAVRRALDALLSFGLLVEVAPYVKETSTPAQFSLQLDYAAVDREGLECRRDARHSRDSQRTQVGRAARHPIQSDNTPPIQSDLSDSPIQSDRTPPVNGTDDPQFNGTERQKKEEKHRGKPGDGGEEARDERGFPFNHPAVEMFVEQMNPDPGLSIELATKITAEVKDIDTWREVLVVFSANGYRGRDGTGRNVGNAIYRYWQEIGKKQKAEADSHGSENGRGKRRGGATGGARPTAGADRAVNRDWAAKNIV